MIQIYENTDCMEGMEKYKDVLLSHKTLAIVDTPYGINFAKTYTGKGWIVRESKDWDKDVPKQDYWDKLFSLSKNQIVWGANYLTNFLPSSMGWVFWDKGQRNFSLADGELAFTSYNKALRVFEYSRGAMHADTPNKFHPTTKPVALYRWLIKNYLKDHTLILDTHVGSASSLIAYEEAGLNYIGFELDTDYYKQSKERLEKARFEREAKKSEKCVTKGLALFDDNN